MENKRISWIDVCRGLGILFVIYGHALDKNSIRFFFYAFHMPLFFFLAGMVHNHKKAEKITSFLKKNVKRIMLPYFFFAAITYAIWFITMRQDPVPINNFLNHMYGVLYGNGNGGYLFFNVILWFLPCLFISKIIFELVTRISDNKFFLSIVLFFFAVTGYVFSLYFNNVKLPFGLETAFTAVVFVGLGYMLFMQKEKIIPFIEKHKWKIMIISFVILVLTSVYNFNLYTLQIDMRLNRLNNVFLFYASSLTGILWCISVSIIIQKNRFLEYLGKNSLPLFALHNFIFYFITLFIKNFTAISVIYSLKNTVLAPLYSLSAIGVTSVLLYATNNIRNVFSRGKENNT